MVPLIKKDATTFAIFFFVLRTSFIALKSLFELLVKQVLVFYKSTSAVLASLNPSRLYNAKHVPFEALNNHKTPLLRVVDVVLYSSEF
jgi:hypothetical protein